MSFGNELKDFVQGFQSGYEMVEKSEERKLDRQERAEDRQYRRQRDAAGDMRWDKQFDYRVGRDAVDDQWRASGRAREWEQDDRTNAYRDRQEARQGVLDDWNVEKEGRDNAIRTRGLDIQERGLTLREDELKLDRAKDVGANGGVIPDDYEFSVPGSIPQPRASKPAGGNPSDAATPERTSDAGGNPLLARASWTPAGGSSFQPSSGERTARGTMGMSGPDIARSMVYDLNRDLGLPMEAGIGLVGQLAGETGGFKHHQELKPVVPGSRGGAGYSQWTGPRRKQFERFAADHGLDPRSYEANYGFLRWELTRTNEGRILDRIADVRDPIQAGRLFTGSEASRSGFLRPRIVNTAGRDRWTRRVAGLFGGGQNQVRAARGGMIEEQPAPAFDEDDPLGNEYEGAEEQYPSVPTPTPAPRGAIPDPEYDGEDAEQDSEGPSLERNRKIFEAGQNAVRDGLTHLVKSQGLDSDEAIADPELEKVRQDYLKGYGAAPAQMMRRVGDMIDPDKQMTPAQRNMAAMGNVYNFFMERGELEKAQEAAASMIQFYRQSSQQFLGLAQAAASEGKLDDAGKALLAAYTNVPDGRDLAIEKDGEGFKITFTDAETGEEMEQSILSPQQFGAAVMKLSPANFDDAILQAAGQKKQTVEAMDPAKASEYDDLTRTMVEERLGEDHQFSPEQVDVIGDVAFGIGSIKDNNIPPAQAARLAIRLASAEAKQNEDGEWVIEEGGQIVSKKVPNSDLYSVKIGGRTIMVEPGTLDELQGVKSARRGEAVKDAETGKARTDRNAQAWGNAKQGFADALGAVGNAFGSGNNVEQGVAIPEADAATNREFLDANPDLAGPAARRAATSSQPTGQTPPTANPAAKNPELVRLEEQRELILSDPGVDSPAMQQELARIDAAIERLTGGGGAIPE